MTAQSENETFRREGYGPSSLAVGERGARTRQRIVEETLRLFETQGFHATSVEGIAKAAGTSRSTLYQYFESKEQIFVELLDECGSALMRVVRRIGPLGPTRLGFDNLHWWLGEWAYVYDKYATMFVQWASVDTPGTSVRPLVTGFTHSYNTRIAARLESSGITGLTPVDAAVAMTSIVHRFNYFRHMGLMPHRFTADQLLDGLAVFVQLLLFPDTPLEVFGVVELPPSAHRRPESLVPSNEAFAQLPDRLAGVRPRAAATVRRLLDASALLFADRGYHGTGVDDVVGEAGFARGTFYKYFDEKLDLFVKLLDEKPVTWEGTTRAALNDADVFPKTESGRLTTWVGVGGSPQSVVRTAHHGLRLMLAIIGGAPARFAPYIELYQRATEQFGTTAYPVGMHSPGFIAETDEEAKELFYPGYKEIRDRIGALRGWPPLRRAEFDAEVEHGSLYIGAPETVARKMTRAIQALGVGRFDLIYSAGGALSASARLRAVELYGTQVVPMVKEMLAEQPVAEGSR